MNNEFAIVWAHKDRLLLGLANTIGLAVIATALSLVVGALMAAALASQSRVVRRPTQWLVDGMRCVPFLLLAYIVYYGLPTVGIRLNNWTAGLAALVIYHSSYIGEILRGAWSNLPRVYIDAAHAVGFHGHALYRRIILPPIVFAAVPVLGNQVIQIIKDTAFLMIIAVPELTHAASSIQATYYVPFAAFVVAVALYWVLCRGVEMVVGVVERRAEARR
jgi:polar amino acid transport system permease protein